MEIVSWNIIGMEMLRRGNTRIRLKMRRSGGNGEKEYKKWEEMRRSGGNDEMKHEEMRGNEE